MTPDREKVIEGLREMSCRCTWKDIDRIRDKFQPIVNGAIELLKEQEAPTKEELLAHYGETYTCKRCGSEWCQQTQKYCQYCGKAVKWDA